MPLEVQQRRYGTSQGIVSIWQGMDVSNWLRLLAGRPPLHWRQALRLGLVSAMSVSNSALKLVEQFVYGAQLRRYELRDQPLFILGHWRSGTTLLHQLLSADPRMICPNLYQALSPHHCLLSEPIAVPLTRWLLPKTRPMDDIAVAWDAPQEDEIALCGLTGMSPYMMLAYQGQRWKYERFFDMQRLTAKERETWKAAFVTFLKKVELRSEKSNRGSVPGRRVLLKSPAHSYRIPLLLELFPKAQFIHIVRNPHDVFASSMHLRERLFDSNCLGRPRHEGAEEDVCWMYEHMFRVFETDRKLLSPEQFHELRYEDLERDPISELAKLYTHLKIDGFKVLETALEGRLDAHRKFRKNQFVMDESVKRRIYARWRGTFERYGYPSGLAEPSPAREAEYAPCETQTAKARKTSAIDTRLVPSGAASANA